MLLQYAPENGEPQARPSHARPLPRPTPAPRDTSRHIFLRTSSREKISYSQHRCFLRLGDSCVFCGFFWFRRLELFDRHRQAGLPVGRFSCMFLHHDPPRAKAWAGASLYTRTRPSLAHLSRGPGRKPSASSYTRTSRSLRPLTWARAKAWCLLIYRLCVATVFFFFILHQNDFGTNDSYQPVDAR